MTLTTSFLTLGISGMYQVDSSQFLLFASGSKWEILIGSS